MLSVPDSRNLPPVGERADIVLIYRDATESSGISCLVRELVFPKRGKVRLFITHNVCKLWWFTVLPPELHAAIGLWAHKHQIAASFLSIGLIHYMRPEPAPFRCYHAASAAELPLSGAHK
jgi:hypothetical protein